MSGAVSSWYYVDLGLNTLELIDHKLQGGLQKVDIELLYGTILLVMLA